MPRRRPEFPPSLPVLLQRRHSDEFSPPPWTTRDRAAVAGVVDAVMIAVAIQRGLQAAEWPDSLRYLADDAALFNGLKVRIGVHYCEEVEPKYEAERDYWDYYGPDVNVAARVEALRAQLLALGVEPGI